MSASRPEPSRHIPDTVAFLLQERSPETLRAIAEYATDLAEHYERQLAEETDDESSPEQGDNRPEGVPGKATITTKKINDNRYYYWQWRDGDQVKSKYKGPVNEGE